MKTTIIELLKRIEGDEGFHILYACESGSRAWGFSSPDSDYDIRFIYIRPLRHYLSLQKTRDTFGMPIENALDIEGWDLQKVLKLMIKSNAVLYEWLNSPIVYMDRAGFRARLLEFGKNCFSAKLTLFHYLGQSKNARESGTKEGRIKLKKYLYQIRTLLAAKWVEDKREIPPMEFSAISPQLASRPDIEKIVCRLLEVKSEANEDETIATIPELQEFIQKEDKRLWETAKNIPETPPDLDYADRFFVETLGISE